MRSLKNYARQLTLLLDRRGSRWLVASLLPVAGRFLPDGVRRLRYDRGWVHWFDNAVVVEPTPRLKSSDLSESRNGFLWGLLYTPKPGDKILDVGAGLGSESIYFAQKVGKFGRVVAVEAHPVICGYLQRSVELGGLDQVEVVNAAVGDDEGTVLIEDDQKDHLGNAIAQGNSGIPVRMTTLDDICSNCGLDRIDFLKMNIEGAETLALQGMASAISKTAIVSISCHDFKYERTANEFFRTKEVVERYFHEKGFILVPRSSHLPEVSDQVNAFNPKLVDVSGIEEIAQRHEAG